MSTTHAESADWLLFGGNKPSARARLFCFHHAGGAASMYRKWAEEVPPELELLAVQLPGREFRIREKGFTRVEPLVQELLRVLGPFLDRPFAFFGHSMGATVGFELARALRRRGERGPAHFGVSGRIAPHLRSRFTPVHELQDRELVNRLMKMGGLPEHILKEPELMALVLPLVRNDYGIVDNYQLVPEPPLACPMTVFWGHGDIIVSREEAAGWQQHTTGSFSLHGLPGDHFFVGSARRELQQLLFPELKQALGQ